MADIKIFVKKIIDEQMKTKYPHAALPAAMLAKITKAELIDEGFRYSLKILDKNMGEDETVPEIPGVISSAAYIEGDVVAVAMLYGLMLPFIVGRYIT